ncbi:MAG: MBL fold metallo-hydrolase [Nitrososphaerota archaeon]|nr:MBL fold metallo-hydrolase [Nitrososphaerota archaeon]
MVEILPGVHQIDGVNANSYAIVEDDGSLTIIDTGMSKDVKKILHYVETKMSKKPSDVKTIVLTHSHIDHVRGAYEMRKASGARLAIHEQDADYLSGKKKMPYPKGAIGFMFRIFSPLFKFTPVEPDQRLKENDSVGGGRLSVLHTPGHTPGSISLYDKERKLILVGDTIRYMKGRLQGPPKQFTLDMNQAIQSVQKISDLDFNTMLSGHGEPFKSSDAPQKVKELSAFIK